MGDILFLKDALRHILQWIFSMFMFNYFINTQLADSAAGQNWKDLKFYWFCFMVPVIEEILFRGIILMNLLNIYPVAKLEELYVMISSVFLHCSI